MPFLPPNQQHQSTGGKKFTIGNKLKIAYTYENIKIGQKCNELY